VAFIGAGNLAWNMVSGLLELGLLGPGSISVCNRADEGRLRRFAALGITAARDKALLLRGAGTVILATKPQDAAQALGEAAPCLEPGTLLVSAVAGLPFAYLRRAAPAGVHLVRAMPNTSCQVGQSATAIARGAGAPDALVSRARDLFGAVGEVYEVQEPLLDAITAVSGSGPAYFYFFTESLIKAAEQVGLETGLARDLVLQTLQGAATMLRRPGADPAQLRAQVTSARGTTEAALGAMARLRLPEAVLEGVISAARRSQELSAAFGNGAGDAPAQAQLQAR
jgi:pyrroline-5-carboxylate reductase